MVCILDLCLLSILEILDEETEQEIINSINSMKGKKTIIISSHKKEILKKCDEIYKVENQVIEKIN